MAKCVNCGAETTLYVFGTPICIACDDEAKGGPLLLKKPAAIEELQHTGAMADELSSINSELTAAREAYRVASERVTNLEKELDPSNAEGVTAVCDARVALSAAWDRYQTALLAFGRHRVP